MVDITNQLGSSFALSSGAPATYDQSGYEAKTYTAVGGVLSVPPMGDASETISADVLAEGRRQIANGTKVGQEVTIPMLHDPSDPGQVIIAANVDTNNLFSAKVTDASGNVFYQTGYLGSLLEGERSTGSPRTQTFVFRPLKAPVRVNA